MFTSSSSVPRTQKKKTRGISFTRSTEDTSLMELGPIDSEDEGTTILRKIGIYQSIQLSVLEDPKLQQYRCENTKYRNVDRLMLLYREPHGTQTRSGGKIQRQEFRSVGLLRSTNVSGQHIGLFFTR